LKQIDKEDENAHNIHKNAQQKKEKDYEEFMDDLENNPDMRAQVNLYKNKQVIKEIQDKKMEDDTTGGKDSKKRVRVKGNKKGNEIAEEGKDGPVKEKEPVKKETKDEVEPSQVKVEELLDEFEQLNLNDKPEEDNAGNDDFVEEFISKLDKIKIEK